MWHQTLEDLDATQQQFVEPLVDNKQPVNTFE